MDVTVLGRAGLHGWRKHYAEWLSRRMPIADDVARTLFGAFFFATSVVYVARTIRDLRRELRR